MRLRSRALRKRVELAIKQSYDFNRPAIELVQHFV